MTTSEAEAMNDLELLLLWDGVEDFTGLWQAAALARDNDGDLPDASPRERARRTLGSLVERGLIVIYTCRGIPTDESCDQVRPERLTELLMVDASWEAPNEGDLGVWYDTTDDGFTAYREASGWRG